jgi:hypothetical protein
MGEPLKEVVELRGKRLAICVVRPLRQGQAEPHGAYIRQV